MKKSRTKAVWPWEYNGGEAYKWSYGQNPRKIIENRREK